MDRHFDEFWEHYPATAPYGVAEPSESTKILAKLAWDRSRAIAIAEAEYIADAEWMYKASPQTSVDACRSIAEQIRQLAAK